MEREHETADLIDLGSASAEIGVRSIASNACYAVHARRLKAGGGYAGRIEVTTVKSHVRALFTKLGVGDLPQYQKRTELARRALQRGLVTQSDLRRL